MPSFYENITPNSLKSRRPSPDASYLLKTKPRSYMMKEMMLKDMISCDTYKFIHNHSNFLDSSSELIKINMTLVHDIEVFEVFTKEYLVLYVLIVLLTNLFAQLVVKSI